MRIINRVEMWEGISRPENGRDGTGEKNPRFLVPGDVPGERQRSVRNPTGRQNTYSLLKIEIITKNRNLLKYLLIITFSILARFGIF